MIKWTFPEIENPPNGLVKPFGGFKSGDPYGNWTHDSAVKGRRLNLLTNGPIFRYEKCGSGNWIWTGDTLGMNQVL